MDRLNAFITLDKSKLNEDKIKVAVKDNICVAGMRMTCGSRILKDFVPHYSATAVRKLLEADMVVVGKTNMDEFAMGSSNKSSYFGPVKNPVNEECIPGGSSGGSCAAVKAGMCDVALGSDTGGSIRQPAAYCGVVGIKPTYGTVSRYGLVAYASSLEQIGPIAGSVSGCAKMLEVIAGYDEKDSTSVKREEYDFVSHMKDGVKGMRIAVPKQYFTEDLQEEIKVAVYDAVKVLQENGAIVTEIDIDYTEYAVMAYYIIACAEASSNLARFDGVKYGFRANDYNDLQEMYSKTREEGLGEEVKKRISLGEYVLSSGFYDEHYLQALKVRRLIKEQFDRLFMDYDVILSPVTKTTAPKMDENLDDIKVYMDDLYTVSANLCGTPAISVPFGKDRNRMPIGVQLMGKHFGESDIIRVAYLLEQIQESR